MSSEQLQTDEIDALSAIFGEEWVTEDSFNRVYSITLKNTGESNLNSELKEITMQIRLPSDYPISAPPVYTLSAPWMSRLQKAELNDSLQEIFLQNPGDSIIYQWIDKAREFIENAVVIDRATMRREEPVSGDSNENLENHVVIDEANIFHGEPITDRRSTFQAHVVLVKSQEEALSAVRLLKENKKVADATHNITAYRISKGSHGSCLQDCDDDGEQHAGSRLLHLLEILEVRDVLVMVSRWFGGIQLGPDRFKHINNVTRNLLEVCGMIEEKEGKAGDNSSRKKKPK